VLLLDQVPGIQSLLLNGQPLIPVSPEESRYEIELGILPAWNQLALEIEAPRSADPPEVPAPLWGVFALLIVTPGPAEVDRDRGIESTAEPDAAGPP
jgi:hypothetical protein